MIRLGYLRYTAHLVIAGVMTAATAAALSFGSVRAAGVLLFLGAVAGAGIFTDRKSLIATVVASIALIFALVFAEWQGWLVPRNVRSGAPALVTYITTILVVALMVYYSRNRTEQTLSELTAELDNRRRTEKERDRNLERFRRIFHTSPSPMLAQSARNGAILDVNPAFERCYGYTRDQVLGRTDNFLWADQAQRARYLERLIGHRRTDQEQATALRADGQHFEALISSELGDDPEDRLVITTVADITAQNEALERVRRSEERFAKAFNFAPMNLAITRLDDGQIVEVNRPGNFLPGLKAGDLRGKTTMEAGGWLTPEDRQAFVDRLRRDGRLDAYESKMRSRRGQHIDVRLWAVIIDIDGEQCILSSTVDITEEKRREAVLLSVAQGMTGETGEAFFRALTRHAATAFKADLVVVSELLADQRVQTLAVSKNGALHPNFIYSPQGTPCGETLSRTDLCVHEDGLATAFPAEQPLTGIHANAYVGQCLRDQDGTAIGVLKAMWRQPISLNAEMRALMSIFSSRATAELMRLRREREIQQLNATLENRVRERTADLQKLNAELDSFAYSVSHDLKSPLRAIDGFTLLLQESMGERLKDDERDIFQRVLVATGRMSRLIADLLALARISQGSMSRDPVDLSAMALEILGEAQQRQPGRRLQWRVSPGLHANCDARLLRIALENLIGNAVKYTRDQPEPLIEVGQREVILQTQEFFVRDNGSGFDMAHADKLFKPFQRLHMPSSGFEGTGIGLATVRRIVERHGGSIRGESVSGQGATFAFHLGLPSQLQPAAPPGEKVRA